MSSQPNAARVIRFGLFELDLSAGELRKQDRNIKLQDQPFQVLVLLATRPGDVVTREELQRELWSADTFVEFDQGLNTAIKKIRLALGDSADNPRFVETIPRKGYRFIAPVAGRPEPAKPKRPWQTLLWATGVAVLAVAVAAGFWFRGSTASEPEDTLVAVPLTSYPGTETSPSFSPDGTQVAFEWCPGPGKGCDIYIKQIGVEAPFQLTANQAESFSPAWSPDGQTIAFLRDVSPTKVALVLIPQRRGPERVLAEFDEFRTKYELGGPFLDWTPDSRWLVSTGLEGIGRGPSLFLVAADTGEKRRLTTPTSPLSDTTPAFSPDGHTLVFTRGFASAHLYYLRLMENYIPRGEPERIALDNSSNSHPTWMPNGREIVFTSGEGAESGLWRIAVTKPPRPHKLSFAPDRVLGMAVSRQRGRLAYVDGQYNTNIWRVELESPSRKPRGVPFKFIASTGTNYHPAYSPDGKRVAFLSTRSGSVAIWVCENDGSNPLQLPSVRGSDIMGPRWSPNGQRVAFTAFQEENEDLYVVSANGGAPQRLTTHPAQDAWPYWSHDSRLLYFRSSRTGRSEIWKMPSSGGEAVQITRNGGDYPQESPDGKFVYYERGWPSLCSIWRIPVEGGEETRVLDGVLPLGKWAVGKEGIYFFTGSRGQSNRDICLYEFAAGKTTKVLTIKGCTDAYIAVSPDGRTILYPQLDQNGSDLMLVENFR